MVISAVWLEKEALIKRLDAEIDGERDDQAALSHEAREKAEAEVMGDLLDIERHEAALAFAAWQHGLACDIAAIAARSRCSI